jgi:hypothetical protein
MGSIVSVTREMLEQAHSAAVDNLALAKVLLAVSVYPSRGY